MDYIKQHEESICLFLEVLAVHDFKAAQICQEFILENHEALNQIIGNSKKAIDQIEKTKEANDGN